MFPFSHVEREISSKKSHNYGNFLLYSFMRVFKAVTLGLGHEKPRLFELIEEYIGLIYPQTLSKELPINHFLSTFNKLCYFVCYKFSVSIKCTYVNE